MRNEQPGIMFHDRLRRRGLDPSNDLVCLYCNCQMLASMLDADVVLFLIRNSLIFPPPCQCSPDLIGLFDAPVNRLECKGVTYDMDLLLGEQGEKSCHQRWQTVGNLHYFLGASRRRCCPTKAPEVKRKWN